MSKSLNPPAGWDNVTCDECGDIATFICTTCGGDYCKAHRKHDSHEDE